MRNELAEVKPEAFQEDRARTEQALSESEQRYKRLLTAITDYIYTVELTNGHPGATTHGPGCESVTGYTAREFAEDCYLWYSVIYDEDREAVMSQVARILKDEQPPPLEHRIVHKDGRVRWIRNTTIPHHDPQGQLVGYDGLISDVTNRKQAEEKLREANAKLGRDGETLRKMVRELQKKHRELREAQERLVQTAKLELVGTLAAGVAHEVKNPLQTIIMGLHLISRKLSSEQQDPDLALALAEMREAVVHAKAIIGDLLTLSSPMEFSKQLEDVNSVVEGSLGMVKNELVKAKVNVVRQLASDLPPVPHDPVRIKEVFINLLLNSIQAMPNRGTITVTTRALQIDGHGPSRRGALRNFTQGDRVVIAEFRDTGCGIKEEHFPRIFDPFFTTKPPGVGVGLGLSMAKKIIDLHGAAIELENSPTGGVVATVVLRV